MKYLYYTKTKTGFIREIRFLFLKFALCKGHFNTKKDKFRFSHCFFEFRLPLGRSLSFFIYFRPQKIKFENRSIFGTYLVDLKFIGFDFRKPV